MKIKWALLIVLVLGGGQLWRLAEPLACRDLDYDYSALSATELGLIASSCRREAMARLYYQRAYFTELLEGREVAGLADGHRLYMGMVEAFSSHWFPAQEARLDFLNQQYEQATERAEIQLRQQRQFAEAQPRLRP